MSVLTSNIESNIFKVLSDNSPNMIFVNDFEKIVYVNLKCTEVLGFTDEEFLSPEFKFMSIIGVESRDVIGAAFAEHSKGNEVDPTEYVLFTKAGKPIHVINSTKLVKWEGKNAILGIVTDISEYKKLENELRRSEEKYIKLLEGSKDGVYGIKREEFIYVNRHGAEMLGYDSPAELVGTKILDVVSPEYRDRVGKWSTARQRGERPPDRYEVQLLRKNGSAVHVEFNISTVELDGELVNLTIVRDITENVEFREHLTALHSHAVRLASAETMNEIISLTLDAMEEALKFQFFSFLTVKDGNLVINSRLASSQGSILPLDGSGLTVRAANTQKSVLVNDTRLNSDYHEGTMKSLSELDVPIIVAGETVGVLNVEGKLPNMFTEKELQLLELLAVHVSTAIDRLNREREVEKMRQDQFKNLIEGFKRTSAGVSHDLRSPLQTIVNALHILRAQPENEAMMELLRSKTKFIETVLDDWKQQTQSGSINRTSVNVHGLISSAMYSITIPPGVKVNVKADESTEFMLDNNSIIRVLSNLIKNSVDAVKGEGTIEITANLTDAGLQVQVRDDGEGIKPKLLPQVFTPFFTTKETGTGIGLSFVKETVEAHRGQVHITSHEGEGTTVSMTFPRY